MSSQLPPSEYLPIFDSSVFTVGDEALTYNKALKYFLRFPFAQGTETLATTNVSGVLTANSTSIFNDVVTINNGAGGQTHGIIIYDPPTGLTNTIANLTGNLLLTSTAAKTITLSSGSNNGLVLSNTTLTTAVPLPINTDNSNKIATTAFVQSVNKPATTILVTTTSANANYYIPMITANGTANYPLFVPSLISFNPSTGALTTSGQIQGGTVLANNSMTIGTAVANSVAFSINNGGQTRIYNSGNSQYTQMQTLADIDSPVTIPYQINPPYSTYMNFNVNGLVSVVTSAGQKPRLEFGCGQAGANEVDMCSSSATLAGGFNFYNKSNTVPLTLIGKIPPTQPVATDNSQNLATTAWVQSATLPLYTTKFTYFSPAAFDPTSTTSSQIVSITGVSPSAFVQVAGIVPPSYKFRLSYNLYSTDYAIAYSFTSMIDVYPSRLTAAAPVTTGNTSYGTGNLTTYNLTNAVAGLATTFNYTNATYTPFNRPYWVSCQNGGLFSGGNTTFLYILIGWGNQISGQVPLSISLVTPGIVGAPTSLNPTNGFTAGQFAMSNYTIEYLGSNVGSGIVTLL